ncbi:hypothetical protein XBP1_2070048 [Xenorhabdus bovienii str. puntauvense]|uniref:Uncharacterized protein n=1 Tax=Xenorhabdus bovienii str. puntauvense TaxID=1398201 RepID=A0A077NDU0_XENBV|nr:hypothetical protein XBFFR1_2180048 [Xenorhabdus bovienii str. feltiae France]CDG92691.1 hypothetical protein XBFFL1_2280019 [Xenorhabdus bovienii str. feltiae Florida]CDG96392.1 hypothetical protein XBP1_2070048 [Xenorhabdus bovienii str. puntauvense]
MMQFCYCYISLDVIDDFFHDDIPNKTVYILINYNLVSS